MKKKLFQYAILYHKHVDGKYTDTTVLVAPNTILAESEAKARFSLIRQVPEEEAADSDNVEIILRPF